MFGELLSSLGGGLAWAWLGVPHSLHSLTRTNDFLFANRRVCADHRSPVSPSGSEDSRDSSADGFVALETRSAGSSSPINTPEVVWKSGLQKAKLVVSAFPGACCACLWSECV